MEGFDDVLLYAKRTNCTNIVHSEIFAATFHIERHLNNEKVS